MVKGMHLNIKCRGCRICMVQRVESHRKLMQSSRQVDIRFSNACHPRFYAGSLVLSDVSVNDTLIGVVRE
jgi:hypothetical protein